MIEKYVSYGTWKQLADSNDKGKLKWLKYHVLKNEGYEIIVGHREAAFESYASSGSNRDDYDSNYLSTSTMVSSSEDAKALLYGLNTQAEPVNKHGAKRIQVDPRQGSKVQMFSQNFCDKTTWYSDSTRITGSVMNDVSGSGLVWELSGGQELIVDSTHGKIPLESRLISDYSVNVYVSGVLQPEGDYTVAYDTAVVTFLTGVSGSVTMDRSKVNTSAMTVVPKAGKKLTLIKAELQLSDDLSMRDAFVFSVRGKVDKFPALAPYWDENGGPYPAGTSLPLENPIEYKTVVDVVAESNLSHPLIKKTTNVSSSWRDLSTDLQIFSWNYDEQATIELSDAWGMDIHIELENDIPPAGKYSFVTFYCISEDE